MATTKKLTKKQLETKGFIFTTTSGGAISCNKFGKTLDDVVFKKRAKTLATVVKYANEYLNKSGVGTTKTAKRKTKAKGVGTARQKKGSKKTLAGSKYHKVSKPVGGVMNSRKQIQLVQLGSMKPAQRFMFPNGKAAYTFKGFTKANAARYESEKGGTYESKNLKINVALI